MIDQTVNVECNIQSETATIHFTFDMGGNADVLKYLLSLPTGEFSDSIVDAIRYKIRNEENDQIQSVLYTISEDLRKIMSMMNRQSFSTQQQPSSVTENSVPNREIEDAINNLGV